MKRELGFFQTPRICAVEFEWKVKEEAKGENSEPFIYIPMSLSVFVFVFVCASVCVVRLG